MHLCQPIKVLFLAWSSKIYGIFFSSIQQLIICCIGLQSIFWKKSSHGHGGMSFHDVATERKFQPKMDPLEQFIDVKMPIEAKIYLPTLSNVIKIFLQKSYKIFTLFWVVVALPWPLHVPGVPTFQAKITFFGL